MALILISEEDGEHFLCLCIVCGNGMQLSSCLKTSKKSRADLTLSELDDLFDRHDFNAFRSWKEKVSSGS